MPRTSFPTYLQSLHQFRPTKPSQGFTGTGLGRFKPQGLKTPGSFQTYLLFTMYSEQASVLSDDANFYFFRRIFPRYTPKPRSAIGGAERDRTADPLLAKQVLSQLSYSPNHRKHPTAKPPGIR